MSPEIVVTLGGEILRVKYSFETNLPKFITGQETEEEQLMARFEEWWRREMASGDGSKKTNTRIQAAAAAKNRIRNCCLVSVLLRRHILERMRNGKRRFDHDG